MTEEMKLAGFTLSAAMLCFTLRSAHRQAGAAAALAAGLMLFFFAVTRLSPAVETLGALAEKAGVGGQTGAVLLKLVAMAYVTEFAVQACRDAGEEGLAAKAALCGKMLLLAQTLPFLAEIGQLTFSFVP